MKQSLHTLLTCLVKEKSESNQTPKFFSFFFFSTVTKLTIHNYKQEQKQDMHIIMTLAQHVLEYITQIQLFNTPIQFQVILVNNLTIKKKYITNSIFFLCLLFNSRDFI